jgi:hypothetical protein
VLRFSGRLYVNARGGTEMLLAVESDLGSCVSCVYGERVLTAGARCLEWGLLTPMHKSGEISSTSINCLEAAVACRAARVPPE